MAAQFDWHNYAVHLPLAAPHVQPFDGLSHFGYQVVVIGATNCKDDGLKTAENRRKFSILQQKGNKLSKICFVLTLSSAELSPPAVLSSADDAADETALGFCSIERIEL